MNTEPTASPQPAAGPKGLAKLPGVSAVTELAQTKGWGYVLTWGHRISGLLLVGYALFHVFTLTGLSDPAGYDAKMKILSNPFFVFLEWALAIPVILHAMNGGRLLMFELYGRRNDQSMINWVLILSAIYVIFLGAMMILSNQVVSPGFFWLTTMIFAVMAAYQVSAKLAKVRHAWTWKIQRVAAAFLFVAIPAHMILAHLTLGTSHEAAQVVARMQNGFIKVVDSLILLAVAYHAAYGLVSLARDYLSNAIIRFAVMFLIVFALVLAAYTGLSLTWAI